VRSRHLLAALLASAALVAAGCGGEERSFEGHTRAQWAALLDNPATPLLQRREAVDGVGVLALDDPAASARLLAKVRGSDPDEETRRRAVLALAACGEPAAAALVAALDDASPRVVETAVAALGGWGARAGSAAPKLAALLAAPESRVSHQAALALGHLGPAGAEALAQLVAHQDPTVRALAVGALAKAEPGSARSLALLLTAAKDPDWNVRKRALTALGVRASDAEGARAALAGALDDPHPFVAAAAARALGEAGHALAFVSGSARCWATSRSRARRRFRAGAHRGPRRLPAIEAALAKRKARRRGALAARWRSRRTRPSVRGLSELVEARPRRRSRPSRPWVPWDRPRPKGRQRWPAP
jgi:HEAT repeat protein